MIKRHVLLIIAKGPIPVDTDALEQLEIVEHFIMEDLDVSSQEGGHMVIMKALPEQTLHKCTNVYRGTGNCVSATITDFLHDVCASPSYDSLRNHRNREEKDVSACKNHNRDYLKHVRIINPPFLHLAEVDSLAPCDSFPLWVSEACVGLEFDPAVFHADKLVIQIPLLDWIGALMSQNPQVHSLSAAKWINEHVYWGGSISTPIENVEILGIGKLLEKGENCF